MTVIKKSDVPEPVLSAEVVAAPGITGHSDGELIAQMVTLTHRLSLFFNVSAEEMLNDPEKKFEHISKVLAVTIVDAEKRPFRSAEGWEIDGSKHMGEALDLFNKVLELSGMKEDSEKKEQSPPS